jgi:glycosyltransferase involved in cell wall biosynthesis
MILSSWICKIKSHIPDQALINILFSSTKSCFYKVHDKFNLLKGRRQKGDWATNKNPLISVYIPTYNRADLLLSRALPSVLGQTYKNFELIIVSDGSTDDTRSRVEAINDPRIKFYELSRQAYRYPNKAIYHWFAGPVIAANHALDRCKGSWIARIDDDDIWMPDHLQTLLDYAIIKNYEFVSSDYKIIFNNGAEKIVSEANSYPPIGGTQTWLYRNYLTNIKYNIDCWRKSFNRVNDTDLQDRFFKAGVKIGYLAKVTTLIEPRPGEDVVGSQAYLKNSSLYENFYGEKK